MNGYDNVIEIETKILDILTACLNDNTVFEAVDAQDNLFSMSLEEILTDAFAFKDQRVLFPKHASSVLVRFKPLQKGASEMRADGNYKFSFQYQSNIFSFNAMLLEIDSKNLLFTYAIENRLFKHQTRRSTRLNVETLDPVSAAIGNKIFQLINISLGGVGVVIDEPDLFQIGQELPVKLFSENRVFEAIGCVRHVAPLSTGGFICGLSLTFYSNKSLQHIKKFIEHTRQARKNLYRMNLLLR